MAKKNKTQRLFEKLESTDTGYNILRFPEDIDINGTQSIMLLNINTVSGSRYADKEYKFVDGDTPRYQQAKSGSLARKMKGKSRRIDTAIALYMPNNIQTSYGSDWTASEMGVLGAGYDAFTGIPDLQSVQGWKQIWEAAKTVIPEATKNTIAGAVQAITPVNAADAKKAYTRTLGNPYMEVIFNGVENRTFSFTFKFIPKSEKEQKQVKAIVDKLKFHRAPEVKHGNVNNYWLFPSEFDISILHRGQDNEYLFNISTCAMTNLTVQYGADAHYATHEDGGPFFTEVTMEFLEMEAITKERHLEGY